MFWARYGLYANIAVRWNAQEPADPALVAGRLPTDPTTTYINRCLVKAGD
jgi:hypothetical protein